MSKKIILFISSIVLLTSCSNYLGQIDTTIVNLFDENNYSLSNLKEEFDSFDEFSEFYNLNLLSDAGKNNGNVKRFTCSYKDEVNLNLDENVLIIDINDEENFYYYRSEYFVGVETKLYRTNENYIFEEGNYKKEYSLSEGNEFINNELNSYLNDYLYSSNKSNGEYKYYLFNNSNFEEIYINENNKVISYFDEFSNLVYRATYIIEEEKETLTFSRYINRFN